MERTGADVDAFIEAVPSEVRRADARVLIDLMSRLSGFPAEMWGPSIIGFGHYHYVYESGREGDAGLMGFSPRKAATTIYLPEGVAAHEEALTRLGPHTSSVSCLYIKRLADVDSEVLEGILAESLRTVSAPGFAQWRPDAQG